MRKKLVAGNWKMNGELASNAVLLGAVRDGVALGSPFDCTVCVPFPYLYQTRSFLEGSAVSWGAQNVSQHTKGAFTGEVSGGMLSDFGCSHVLVGHSERRALFGESSAVVASKFLAAQAAGVIPILCVGETLAEREAGVTEQVVAEQLDAVLATAGAGAMVAAVIAYEPVWAIGTGRTASPQQAQDVHGFIRSRLADFDSVASGAMRILYGGSVKAGNAGELFAMPDIDGGLIGGASLDAAEFLAICAAAA